MSDAYIYDKIDEGMKSFPWNFPEKYSLPDFLPSPSNFVDGWVKLVGQWVFFGRIVEP